jgi:hypothetical protein
MGRVGLSFTEFAYPTLRAFPDDFMFERKREEIQGISQIVTPSKLTSAGTDRNQHIFHRQLKRDSR